MITEKGLECAVYIFRCLEGMREVYLPDIEKDCALFKKSGLYSHFVDQVFKGAVRKQTSKALNLSYEEEEELLTSDFIEQIIIAERNSRGNQNQV